MRKIGLYLGVDSTGGAFYYSLGLLEALSNLSKDRIELVILYHSANWGEILAKYSTKNRKVNRGIFSRLLSLLWFRLNLSAAIWLKIAPYFDPFTKTFLAEKCDLWVFPAQDPWVYRIPVPSLAVVHDLMHRYERRFEEVSAHGEYERRERHFRHTCAYAKGVLVDSEIGKQQLIESYGIESNRVYVLPFIPPSYVYNEKASQDIQKKYNLPPKYLFYPAQFWSHKNHLALIRVLSDLKESIPDLHLVFTGSKKNAYKHSVDLAAYLGVDDRISFLGYIQHSDMLGLYRNARAMIMPTFFGPTNIPPLEAFVLGCPVAVSNIYGMSDQLGDAALLFDPNSDKDIGEAISKLWVDDKLCEELRTKGKQKMNRWGRNEYESCLFDRITTLLGGILR